MLADVAFQSPVAGAVAVLVAAPLLALGLTERRATRLREVLRLRPPERPPWLAPALALTVLAALLGLAAAQPVLADVDEERVRTDAEAIFLFDTSRSMLAVRERGGPNRLDRARRSAVRIRAAIPQVPAGIVTLTDRALPHLFPTADRDAFATAVARVVNIEQPPPRASGLLATTFAPLKDVATRNFFSPGIERRVVIVLTDGESRPEDVGQLPGLLDDAPPMDLILVQHWYDDELIYDRNGVPELYRPNPGSRRTLVELVAGTGGTVAAEDDLETAVRAARGAVGTGPTTHARLEHGTRPLAPYVVGAAFLPLAFLLWRRNRA